MSTINKHKKGVEETKKKIRKKVKKVKKRLQRKGDISTRVAYNTKADAAKYQPISTFAYRPADSPIHMLKTKNDLVKIVNTDIQNNQQKLQELDSDLSKLQREKEESQRRIKDYQGAKLQRMREREEAKYQEQKAQQEYKRQKKQAKRQFAEILRREDLEAQKAEFSQELEHKHNLAKVNLEMLDAKHKHQRDIETDNLAEKRKVFDKEWQHNHELLKEQRNETIREAKKNTELKRAQGDLNALKQRIEQTAFYGSYERDEHGKIVKTEEGRPKFRKGAKSLANAHGIIYEYGELDHLRARRLYEQGKLVQAAEREKVKYMEELDKYNLAAIADKDPLRKNLQERLDKAKRDYERRAILEAHNKENDKLRKEIFNMECKAKALEARSQADADPETLKEYQAKYTQLELLKRDHEANKEKLKLDRQMAEYRAQLGDPTTLEAQLTEQRNQVAEMQKRLKHFEAVNKELEQSAQTVNKQNTRMRGLAQEWRENLAPYLYEGTKARLAETADPLQAMNIMHEQIAAEVARRQEVIQHNIDLGKHDLESQRQFNRPEAIRAIGILQGLHNVAYGRPDQVPTATRFDLNPVEVPKNPEEAAQQMDSLDHTYNWETT